MRGCVLGPDGDREAVRVGIGPLAEAARRPGEQPFGGHFHLVGGCSASGADGLVIASGSGVACWTINRGENTAGIFQLIKIDGPANARVELTVNDERGSGSDVDYSGAFALVPVATTGQGGSRGI